MDLMLLNDYLFYVAKAINYNYVLFHINVQCIFLLLILKYKNYIIV
jgi:hypothetical protein